jgi:hypothetical protein
MHQFIRDVLDGKKKMETFVDKDKERILLVVSVFSDSDVVTSRVEGVNESLWITVLSESIKDQNITYNGVISDKKLPKSLIVGAGETKEEAFTNHRKGINLILDVMSDEEFCYMFNDLREEEEGEDNKDE